MRQGDGTDLLGPSDPRSASIGVIYVAPTDDRQSILTAILTQDKLGFKQVIVVLPDQNQAFQTECDPHCVSVEGYGELLRCGGWRQEQSRCCVVLSRAEA